MSGTKDSRPELNRLMADAHKRRFDVVAVWRFDRFARSVSHLLRALETFNALGIAFVSLSEQMDTTTPAGKMVFTVLGAVAELERSLIVERVRAGLRNARAKGKDARTPENGCGCYPRRSTARFRCFVAGRVYSNGTVQGHGATGGSWVVQTLASRRSFWAVLGVRTVLGRHTFLRTCRPQHASHRLLVESHE